MKTKWKEDEHVFVVEIHDHDMMFERLTSALPQLPSQCLDYGTHTCLQHFVLMGFFRTSWHIGQSKSSSSSSTLPGQLARDDSTACPGLSGSHTLTMGSQHKAWRQITGGWDRADATLWRLRTRSSSDSIDPIQSWVCTQINIGWLLMDTSGRVAFPGISSQRIKNELLPNFSGWFGARY